MCIRDRVQRTPTEYQCYHWNRPYEGGTSYNNYYLDADNRGCGACHEDLGDALANMEYSLSLIHICPSAQVCEEESHRIPPF